MSAIDVQLPADDRHCSPSIPSSLIAGPPRGLPCSLLSGPSLYQVPESGSSTFGTSTPLVSDMPVSTPISLVSVLQEPHILATFLRYIRWHDFRSLALTSAACRNVLQHPELRDAVLSAYVPGYQYCLRYADLDSSADIDVQLHDLNDFIISQRLPLHLYPTHALATLSSRDMIPVLEKKTQKYITLCQAHSRMVLLLQALIHSTSSPVSEELEDPSLPYRSTSQQRARELVFPAPLSFISNNVESKSHTVQQPTRERVRFFSLPQASSRPRRTSKSLLPQQRSLSLISILGKNKVPPPPPAADPLSLKIYGGSWRGRRRAPAVSGSASEEDGMLIRRPNRVLTSTTDSSLSSSDNSQGNTSPHSPPRLAESVPMSLTPHDMRAATSRLRAPILRVYFPCSELDNRAIAACEEQLDDAGLWHHLSVGDVVCNLGYLPPTDRRGSSLSSTTGDDLTSAGGKYSQESWMIFDGTGLVPYIPSEVLPLSEPLSLPSPLYYAHITRPPINPRFVAVLPHEPEEPELSLSHLPVMVPSPHSPNGLARVKKHVWLARLGPRVRPGLGEGWHCEWVLEGGGTKEGRQSLLDALRGGASSKREWELIMERCTTTRIWLRLMSTMPSDSP